MKREFVINRQGRDYVLYAGLLDEAHRQGLKAIKTHLVQAPTPENGHAAICFAEVTTERGTFTGLGEAQPGNVNRLMANALLRMAETRAKARALRDAVNVGMVAIDELADSASEPLALDETESMEPPARIVSLPSVRQSIRQAAAQGLGAGDEIAAHRPAAGGAPVGGAPPAAPAAPAAAVPPPPKEEAPGAPSAGAPTEGAARPPAPREQPARGSGSKPAPDGPPLPATPTQLETIAKLARSVGRVVATNDLTRAAASELITRLSEERYGARRGS